MERLHEQVELLKKQKRYRWDKVSARYWVDLVCGILLFSFRKLHDRVVFSPDL